MPHSIHYVIHNSVCFVILAGKMNDDVLLVGPVFDCFYELLYNFFPRKRIRF